MTTLSSHLPETISAGIGTAFAVLTRTQLGCRGFTGPVPPPLWIRVNSPRFLCNCWIVYTTGLSGCQEEHFLGYNYAGYTCISSTLASGAMSSTFAWMVCK